MLIFFLKKPNDRKIETLRIKLHFCAQNLPGALLCCSLSNVILAFLIYVFSKLKCEKKKYGIEMLIKKNRDQMIEK